jgi:signal transduction histidine kinase
LVTQVLAFQIANELDRQIMQARAEETAAAIERDKLSRDLHDGILQDLAALDLQLALLGNSRGDEAAQRLDTMKHLVQQEQRRLRDFVRVSSRSTASPASIALGRELQRIIVHAARQWGCATSLSGQPQDAVVPAALGSHLSFLVSEAIANAVRHGRASSIRVGFCRTAEDLQLEIVDNGRGFNGVAFDYDEKELAASGMGPVSLRERVRELGGSLRVRSAGAGVEIKIRLPLT